VRTPFGVAPPLQVRIFLPPEVSLDEDEDEYFFFLDILLSLLVMALVGMFLFSLLVMALVRMFLFSLLVMEMFLFSLLIALVVLL